MRKTAIPGILGIASLCFFVDSALADIRLDRVILFIVFTTILNIGVDRLSRLIRSRLRLDNQAEQT